MRTILERLRPGRPGGARPGYGDRSPLGPPVPDAERGSPEGLPERSYRDPYSLGPRWSWFRESGSAALDNVGTLAAVASFTCPADREGVLMHLRCRPRDGQPDELDALLTLRGRPLIDVPPAVGGFYELETLYVLLEPGDVLTLSARSNNNQAVFCYGHLSGWTAPVRVSRPRNFQ